MNLTTAEYNDLITEECRSLLETLLEKNTDYDSAVFEPIGVFTRTTALEQIKTRIDDKLKRIQHMFDQAPSLREDTLLDLIGYCVLYRVERAAQKLVKLRHDAVVVASGAIELVRKTATTPNVLEHATAPVKRRRRRAVKQRTHPSGEPKRAYKKSTNGRKKKSTNGRKKAANGRRKRAR